MIGEGASMGSRNALVVAMVLVVFSALLRDPVLAADSLKGQVLAAGAPIANSTVTLWAASAGAPKQLGQVRTGADGRFELPGGAAGKGAVLYMVAKGGQPAANKAGKQITQPQS